jgi:hypothetical protein
MKQAATQQAENKNKGIARLHQKANPGSTKKQTHFSFANPCFIGEQAEREECHRLLTKIVGEVKSQLQKPKRKTKIKPYAFLLVPHPQPSNRTPPNRVQIYPHRHQPGLLHSPSDPNTTKRPTTTSSKPTERCSLLL